MLRSISKQLMTTSGNKTQDKNKGLEMRNIGDNAQFTKYNFYNHQTPMSSFPNSDSDMHLNMASFMPFYSPRGYYLLGCLGILAVGFIAWSSSREESV